MKSVWILIFDDDYLDFHHSDMETLYVFPSEEKAREAIPKLLPWCKVNPSDKPKEDVDYVIREEIIHYDLGDLN